MKHEVHLTGEHRLRIALDTVSIDASPGGGARARFELFAPGHEAAPVLSIIQEAPEVCAAAAAAGAPPEPDYVQVTTEAVARLRTTLQAMSAALADIPDEVRRLVGSQPGAPGCIVTPRDRRVPGSPYYRALLH